MILIIRSLFSSFDPIGGWIENNFIIYSLLFFTPVFAKLFFTVPSRNNQILKKIRVFVRTELKANVRNKQNSEKTNTLIAIFFILIILNLFRLIPYIFTATAQISFNLSVGIPFWLRYVLFVFIKNTNKAFSHLVPSGTPIALSQFMVLIESTSQIIRPITLSVRLAANITAGHILIALIRRNIIIFNMQSFGLTFLLILEIAVAIIQRYVFVTLISMYLGEV